MIKLRQERASIRVSNLNRVGGDWRTTIVWSDPCDNQIILCRNESRDWSIRLGRNLRSQHSHYVREFAISIHVSGSDLELVCGALSQAHSRVNQRFDSRLKLSKVTSQRIVEPHVVVQHGTSTVECRSYPLETYLVCESYFWQIS